MCVEIAREMCETTPQMCLLKLYLKCASLHIKCQFAKVKSTHSIHNRQNREERLRLREERAVERLKQKEAHLQARGYEARGQLMQQMEKSSLDLKHQQKKVQQIQEENNLKLAKAQAMEEACRKREEQMDSLEDAIQYFRADEILLLVINISESCGE